MSDELKRDILAIPTREERCGGQTFKYVKLHEVMELLDAQAPAAPQVSVKGLDLDRVTEIIEQHSIQLLHDYGIAEEILISDCEFGSGNKVTAEKMLSAIDTTPVSVMDDPRVQRLVAEVQAGRTQRPRILHAMAQRCPRRPRRYRGPAMTRANLYAWWILSGAAVGVTFWTIIATFIFIE